MTRTGNKNNINILKIAFSLLITIACLSCKNNNQYYAKYYHLENIHNIDFKQERISGFESDLPHKFTWEVQLPSSGYMQFAIGIKPPDYEDFPDTLQILVTELASSTALLNEILKPDLQQGQLFFFKVPLKGFKNNHLWLEFVLKSRNNKKFFSHAIFWEVPRIFSEARPEKPNVLIITIDTLRADHLPCYGYNKNIASHIEKFAQDAVRFSNAYSSSCSTWPALTSLMTSTYPSQHGVIFNGYNLNTNFISLPEILHANGYQTAALLANMRRGTHKGYDYFFRALNDESLTNASITRLKYYKDKTFFMWLHFLGPHVPYEAPAEYLSKQGLSNQDLLYGKPATQMRMMQEKKPVSNEILQKIIKLYDADIDYTDSLVGAVLHELDRLGLKENTLIILSADHGEELLQHLNYFNHSGSVYDSTLHIPLLWHLPKGYSWQKKNFIKAPVSIVDVAPSILQYLNINIPPSFKGINILKLLQSQSLERKWVFSESSGRIYTLRDDKYRYIFNPLKEEIILMDILKVKYDKELYLHSADAQELNNLIHKDPQTAQAYQQVLSQWINANLPTMVPAQTIDAETREQLKALGYVR